MAIEEKMATFAFNTLQQKQLFSMAMAPCKYPSSLSIKSHYLISDFFTMYTLKDRLHQQLYSVFTTKRSVSKDVKMCGIEHKSVTKTIDSTNKKELGSGFSSLRFRQERVHKKSEFGSMVEEKMGKKYRRDGYRRKDAEFGRTREMGSGVSSFRSRDEKVQVKAKETKLKSLVVNEKMTKGSEKNRDSNQVKSKDEGDEKMKRNSQKKKMDSPEFQFRIALDMCSKKGDVLAGISLFESAQREGIKLEQYHYGVLLYLCSSAATGIVHPAKSGNVNRSPNKMELTSEVSGLNSKNLSKIRDVANFDSRIGFPSSSDRFLVESIRSQDMSSDKTELNSNDNIGVNHKTEDTHYRFENRLVNDSVEGRDDSRIEVTEDVRKHALMMGFKIYENMCMEKIPMNEATLTSVARMAMSMGDGDMAFEIVKKMKELGINPRLRSYGPALFTFCSNGEIEKAFEVDEYMLENGVSPEEPELEALLRVSVENGRSDKVYYSLQKLRTTVRRVSPSMAELIERWFESRAASRVGKRKWDQSLIMEAMENGGGGWHGQGWLGKGKWTVARTSVGTDGVCEGCGHKLTTIDLDPVETENFAKSVVSIALKREKHLNFQEFQKWLDCYGPFEAVVDAANVGLSTGRNFSLAKFRENKDSIVVRIGGSIGLDPRAHLAWTTRYTYTVWNTKDIWYFNSFWVQVNSIAHAIRQKITSKKWPLIVVHNRHITGGKMKETTNRMLIERWKKDDAIYLTPTGSNDDWYWLYAAIKFKCLLVTNDEMRDHIFQLLGNDFFPKWKERHQVHFSFSDAGFELHMPPPCSVVIQESEIGHWHIPIASEHDLERERTWLCITRTRFSHKT